MIEIRDIGTGSLETVGEGPEQCRDGRASGPRANDASARPTFDLSSLSEEDVIGYEPLWESKDKCRTEVDWKGSVISFCLNAPTEVARLSDELHDGTYRPRKPRYFTVTYPKRRDIVGIAFRDRVVQRSYNDVVIYPYMKRSWIYDNYACQSGKGTDFARMRMKSHVERHVRERGPNGYVLTMDVRGYYDHLLYDVMDKRFHSKCPWWASEFACRTIRTQYGGDGQGVNPGSQLVQIAGVDYLDPVDHMIKEGLGVKGYGRYMDDLILLSDSQTWLESCKRYIASEIALLGLEPHPTKTRIMPLSKGFRFLGFDYHVDAGGRVYMLVNPDNVKAMRRRVSRLWRLEQSGARVDGTTDAAYVGWRAHAEKGDSKKLLVKCDAWYASLKS